MAIVSFRIHVNSLHIYNMYICIRRKSYGPFAGIWSLVVRYSLLPFVRPVVASKLINTKMATPGLHQSTVDNYSKKTPYI